MALRNFFFHRVSPLGGHVTVGRPDRHGPTEVKTIRNLLLPVFLNYIKSKGKDWDWYCVILMASRTDRGSGGGGFHRVRNGWGLSE